MEIIDQREENVLLLSMSTLPNNPSICLYTANMDCGDSEKQVFFEGISQLEAGTKYFLNLLAGRKSKLNRIVILATKETETDQAMVFGEKVSALEFYQKRIRKYILGEEEKCFTLNEKKYDLTQLPSDCNYSVEELEKIFKVVSNVGETDDPVKNIYFWDAVQLIAGEEGKKINLYMDMQGGHRKISAQMDAVVSLLHARGVTVKARVATDFNPREAKVSPQWIRDVSAEYKTYDLVSAMTVFNCYGRGTELQDYLGKNPLTEAIVKAAESISLCNVDRFEEAIEELKKAVDNIDTGGQQPRTQTDVVLADIRQSFSPLWEADRRLRYVEQIKWCLERKFVQQALTILEARMPYGYVVNGIRYYCKQGEENSLIRKFESLYDACEYNEKYKFLDIDHYYIKYSKRRTYALDVVLPELTLLPTTRRVTKTINRNIDQYNTLCSIRNKTNHAAASAVEAEKSFAKYMKERFQDTTGKEHKLWYPDSLKNETELIDDIQKYLEDFLKLVEKVWENWPSEGERPVSIS